MKKTASALLSIFLLQSLITTATIAKENGPYITPFQKTNELEKNYTEGEVIVKYKSNDAKDKEIQNIEKKILQKNNTTKTQVKKEFTNLDALLISSEEKTTEELIEEYENDDSVEYAEPNYIKKFTYTPNDTNFSYQWSHYNFYDTDIDVTDAWDIEESSANETIVAIIDSGVRYSFSELSGNMWNGGTSYPNHGWDFVDNDNDPDDTYYADDSSFQGHGTFIASIIAAETDDSSGMAGLSRYNNVKIMALRFDLDIASEIEAIEFAEEHGAKVINASFAGSSYSQFEKDAIDDFSGVFVAAAGNGGEDGIGDDNNFSPLYPCNYTSSNIICVASYNENNTLSNFSNYGTSSADIAAPGENVLGYSYGEYNDEWIWTYWIGSGTSYATPFVTGASGLLWAHNPSASITKIKNALFYGSDFISNFTNFIINSRRLNLNTSLQIITDTTPPTLTEITPISTPTSDNTPNYTFNSDEAGIITYGGSCTSSVTNAVSGDNNITLNSLTSGTYNNCTITVTDISENTSNTLTISQFTVTDTTPPTLTEITPVLTPTSDNTPNYTFNSDEAGIITYGGSCTSSVTNAVSGNNNITFNMLADGIYLDCTITVTDISNNVSDSLTVNTFIVNTKKKPIYRFWSSKNKSHFYTASEEERDLVIDEYDDYVWKYEGIAYYAYSQKTSETKPVYRFWSSKNKSHFYTASEEERDLVIDEYDDYVWKYEGIAYYAYSQKTSETKPVYRFWSSKNKSHFYTASEEERDLVIDEYDDYVWKYEGIAWYVAN